MAQHHQTGANAVGGRGAMADRVRQFAWSETALGAIHAWPAALRSAAAAVLAMPASALVLWGEHRLVIPNDRAAALIGAMPAGLGHTAAILPFWSTIEHRVRHLCDGLPDPVPAGDGWSLAPVYDDDAESGVGGVTAMFAETTHLSSDDRLRLGLEAARMVAWEIDLHSGKLSISDNSEAVFGPGSEASDFVQRIAPQDIASAQASFEEALQGPDGLYQSEFRYHHPDGRDLQLQNWGKILRGPDGAPLRIHGVCMDVSERKRVETALRDLNETLEDEVRKRTSTLMRTEQALHQSQKMETLGQLTGGVAHDFNNLLGAIIGSFDLIRRRADDVDRVRSLADAGLKVAERGGRLTAQLLTFSRGQLIALEPLHVGALLDDMRELLTRTLGPLVSLRISPGQECAALSDPTQLELAILNLAINARDAMPGGGVLTIKSDRVQLDDDPELAPGSYAELVVRDTGTGMSQAVAAQAFDPFFTTKELGRGTGLGLSQVHAIAHRAGGVVRIETAEGRGTTVRMLLPSTAMPDDASVPPGFMSAPLPRQDLDVLLVDDDADLRDIMAASLIELGYTVREAADGMAALEALEERAPDVMIADFAMPGMNGAELAASARMRLPDLPIVIASGYTDPDSLGATAGFGIRLLHKPFRIEELQGAIGAVLARLKTS